jgi:hypothetical protein
MRFTNKSIHLGPTNSFFFFYSNISLVSMFSYWKFFIDKEISNGLLTSQTYPTTFIYKHQFIKNKQEEHFKLLIHRQRWFKTKNSLSNRFFRSNTWFESYQYLYKKNLFNKRLLDHMTKALMRKRWFFSGWNENWIYVIEKSFLILSLKDTWAWNRD